MLFFHFLYRIMKTQIIFILIFISGVLSAQNIKVRYIRDNGLTESTEDVYINKGFKISITDSTAITKNSAKYNGRIIISDKGKAYRRIIINNLKSREVFFTYTFNNNNFLVHDTLPDINWKISPKETKKIGKYTCIKATTTYRGTDLEAYFTTEIPISLAPNKIYGLPGLVMEMKTFGENYSIWTVKNIEFPYNGAPDYSPKYIKSLKLLEIKNLVQAIDKKLEEEYDIMQSKLKFPEGVKVEKVAVRRSNPRLMIETKFEWEK